MKTGFGIKMALLALGSLLAVSSARADIIPTLEAVVPSSINTGDFTWIYSVTLTDNSRLDTSSPWDAFFTIMDFNGFVAGSQQSSDPDFTPSSALTGRYADQIGAPSSPPDNPAIPNLTWTWTPTGPSTIPGPVLLGTFAADSIFNLETLAAYEGQSTKEDIGKTDDGTKQGNVGQAVVPTGTTSVIPEPSTMLLLAGGLIMLALFHRPKKTSRSR